MDTQNSAIEQKKIGVVELFLVGAKKGWNVAINTIMPAMVLGYVLVQALQVTGIMTVLANVAGPVMGIFGLPGEAITVIISAFFAKAAGAATALNLYLAGTITAAQATICVMPSMLMGTLVGHYARIVLVSGVNKKRTALMFGVALFDAAIGMLLMRAILAIMGIS